MLSRFVFCTLLVGCLAVPHRFKRSINGTKAVHTEIVDNKLIEHPYAIDYPYVIELDTTGGYLCSGALIRPNIALTARHCLPKNISDFKDVSRYKLLAGNQIYEDRKSPFVQVRQVEKIVVHPNLWHIWHDLAVMKTTKPFDLNIHVNVVKIAPQTDEMRYIGKKTVTLGWGGTQTAGHTEYLMKVEGIVKKCWFTSLICIDGLNGGILRGGDSGGPTVIQGKERKDDLLIGITHGTYTYKQYHPVNLARFSDWINETADKLNK